MYTMFANFQAIVKTNPLELIQVIKKVLLTEQQLIEQAEVSEGVKESECEGEGGRERERVS